MYPALALPTQLLPNNLILTFLDAMIMVLKMSKVFVKIVAQASVSVAPSENIEITTLSTSMN